jgi:hypothetical protein
VHDDAPPNESIDTVTAQTKRTAAKHPLTTPAWVAQRILALCLEHPAWGCVRLARELQAQAIHISSPTVQKILIQHQLGSRRERAAALERLVQEQHMNVSREQTLEIARFNPWFSEQQPALKQPGQLLAQDCALITRNGARALYAHLIVDSYSHYCHVLAHPHNSATAAIELIEQHALPCYKQQGWPARCILTSTAPQYHGSAQHAFGHYLAAHGIEHRPAYRSANHLTAPLARTRALLLSTLGAAELSKQQNLDSDQLQRLLDAWVEDYRQTRIRSDPRVAGARPLDLLLPQR